MDQHLPSEQALNTTTFFHAHLSPEVVVVLACSTLSLYNAIELLLLILTTFSRYSGLYFYSLLIASAGVIPYTLGYLLSYFLLCKQVVTLVLSTIGWPSMVSGQSLVLYSRLGLLLIPDYTKVLRAVKWMIVVDGIVFHISTTVVLFGAFEYRQNDHFVLAYRYIEKIQMTGFSVQEFILSGLYIWRTLAFLRTNTIAVTRQRSRNRRVMIELLSINIWICIMDVALLVVEYQNRHVIEQALKGVVYSTKLKLEFAILSKLISMAVPRGNSVTEDGNEFITTCAIGSTGDRHVSWDASTVKSTGFKGQSALQVEYADRAAVA